MLNWPLTVALVLVCIPGIVVTMPRLINTFQTTIESRMRPGQRPPAQSTLAAVSIAQNLIIVSIAAAIGTALAPRVGLRAPFFEALILGGPLWAAFTQQVLPALVAGTSGALLFVAAYYRIFRPRLDDLNLRTMEALRMRLGAGSRLLYGGIVEEVISRWGLMSLLVWVGTLLFGGPSPFVIWTAIVVTGVFFGLGHLPGHLTAGGRITPWLIGAMIGLNLWASLIFGWLFWQVGLLAAMLAHMLFHLVWLPFEYRHVQPTGNALTNLWSNGEK